MTHTLNPHVNQALLLLEGLPEDFKVLRRLKPHDQFATSANEPCYRGIALDIETTGKRHQHHRIHQLAMILFEYTAEGKVIRVLDRYCGYENPQAPLPPPADIPGPRPNGMYHVYFDENRIRQMLEGVSIVISHNASFDRPFVEKRFGFFSELAWGCSLHDVDWLRTGIRSGKLEHLAMHYGFFYDAHCAEEDCNALLEILSKQLKKQLCTVLKAILNQAVTEKVRVWAEHAYGKNPLLFDREYAWGPNSRCRYKTLPRDHLEMELNWLQTHVYGNRMCPATIHIEQLPPQKRFADRRYKGQPFTFKSIKESHHEPLAA